MHGHVTSTGEMLNKKLAKFNLFLVFLHDIILVARSYQVFSADIKNLIISNLDTK